MSRMYQTRGFQDPQVGPVGPPNTHPSLIDRIGGINGMGGINDSIPGESIRAFLPSADDFGYVKQLDFGRNFGGGQGIQQLLGPLVRKIKQYQKSQATQNLEEQEQKLPPYLQEVEEITNATFPNVFSGGSGISGMNEFQSGPTDRPLGQGIGSLSGFSDLFNQSPYNQNGGELFSQPGGEFNPFGNFNPQQQYFK